MEHYTQTSTVEEDIADIKRSLAKLFKIVNKEEDKTRKALFKETKARIDQKLRVALSELDENAPSPPATPEALEDEELENQANLISSRYFISMINELSDVKLKNNDINDEDMEATEAEAGNEEEIVEEENEPLALSIDNQENEYDEEQQQTGEGKGTSLFCSSNKRARLSAACLPQKRGIPDFTEQIKTLQTTNEDN